MRTQCIKKSTTFIPESRAKPCLNPSFKTYSYLKMATVISIDIGGTTTKLARVDQAFNILDTAKFDTLAYKSEDDFLQALFRAITSMINETPTEEEVLGIGIGAPCGIPDRGVIYGAVNLPFSQTFAIVELVEQAFTLPVFLTKDSYAATLGEKAHGAAKAMSNFIVLTLGTGLGCGIVVNNQLLTGENNQAGELGHTAFLPSDRHCQCGRKGCLETYVSASGIKRTIFQLLATSNQDSVFRTCTFQEVNAKKIFEAAQQGDPLALAAFSQTGTILGAKLAELVALFEPEAIFLAGGLASAGEMLTEPTITAMEQHLLPIYRGKTKVLCSALGTNEAAIIGAASIVWNNLKSPSICLS